MVQAHYLMCRDLPVQGSGGGAVAAGWRVLDPRDPGPVELQSTDRMKKASQESHWAQSCLELLSLSAQAASARTSPSPQQEQQSLGAEQGLKSLIKGGSHGGVGDSWLGPEVQRGGD